MHIHPPKPLHGWREFIGEVGIIVLGILIALAAEQLIEWVHWRHESEQATDSLRTGIVVNALNAIEQQVAGECIDRQLATLEAQVTAPGPFRAVANYHDDGSGLSFAVRAPTRPWADGTWRMVTGEGVASHLPSHLREQIDLVYEGIDEMRGYSRQAETLLWRLHSLSVPMVIDPASRVAMVQDLEELRGRERLMTLVAGQILGSIEEAGMMPPAARIQRSNDEESGTIAFCRAHGLPLNPIKPLRSD